MQIVPWADAGRVGEGESMDWITSAGIGLQRYLWPVEDAANLRLDFAFPFDNPSSDFGSSRFDEKARVTRCMAPRFPLVFAPAVFA